jgi:hypothetical protein
MAKTLKRCQAANKLQHSSKASALDHAVKLMQVGRSSDHRPLDVYRCTDCGDWHVRHQRIDVARSNVKRFLKGDIIVTAVAHHYAIGRIKTDGGIQEHLASEKERAAALAHACRLAGAAHRVFLCKSAGESKFALVDCERTPEA